MNVLVVIIPEKEAEGSLPTIRTALSAGVQIQQVCGGTVDLLASRSDSKYLREGLAIGCQRALCVENDSANPLFWAANLAAFLEKNPYEAVLTACSEKGLQTGALLSEKVGIEAIPFVKEIGGIDPEQVTVWQQLGRYARKVRLKLPVLMLVLPKAAPVIYPSYAAISEAYSQDLISLTFDQKPEESLITLKEETVLPPDKLCDIFSGNEEDSAAFLLDKIKRFCSG